MSKKTRKHIRPVSLVMALAIIVTLSGFIVLATNPGGRPSAGRLLYFVACRAGTI